MVQAAAAMLRELASACKSRTRWGRSPSRRRATRKTKTCQVLPAACEALAADGSCEPEAATTCSATAWHKVLADTLDKAELNLTLLGSMPGDQAENLSLQGTSPDESRASSPTQADSFPPLPGLCSDLLHHASEKLVREGEARGGGQGALSCRWAQTAAGVGHILERTVADAGEPTSFSSFHCVAVPSTSVRQYVEHLRRHWKCSPEVMVISLVYINRLIAAQPDIRVDALSCHKLLAGTMTIAAKFHDDFYYTNRVYAKVAGMELGMLNSLEVELLQLLDYRLSVGPEEFEVYRRVIYHAA